MGSTIKIFIFANILNISLDPFFVVTLNITFTVNGCKTLDGAFKATKCQRIQTVLNGVRSMLDPEILKAFKCTGCGECCRWSGSVLLTERDIAEMAAYLALSEQEFIDGHTRLAPNRIQLALLDRPDGSCSFLDGDRCGIYEARPEQCRSFPFAWSVPEGCPALDALTDR